MSREELTIKFKRITKLCIVLLITSTLFWGCDACDDSSSVRRDADGDILSDRTTGYDLPQSIHTIPAESTSARLQRLNAIKEVR